MTYLSSFRKLLVVLGITEYDLSCYSGRWCISTYKSFVQEAADACALAVKLQGYEFFMT